jgi:hypothetical protein
VDRRCQAIQKALVEYGGDGSGLAEGDLQHLDSCPSCAATARAERGLSALLREARPPADPAVVDRVVQALTTAGRRRRLAALLPVAAALMMTLLGVAMVGGVPGGSLLGQLPLWSTRGWLQLASATGDWVVAMTAVAGAARLTMPAAVQVAALVTSLLGLALAVAATRRWRAVSPWHRER